MALGDITDNGISKEIELLASATGTNSPPSGAAAGIAINDARLYGKNPDRARLIIYSTAGSGTMTATFRLWGYSAAGSVWVPVGTGTGAAKGTVNAGAAIDETGTDAIRHSELVELWGHFDRLYLEITAIGGTATAVTAQLLIAPE